MKVGIFFGGPSREREVSYAGGRTVYDNLDRQLFEPVPLLIDAYGQAILLKPMYLYKGMLPDFFPAPELIRGYYDQVPVPIYAECAFHYNEAPYQQALHKIGQLLPFEKWHEIDFAFLVLHGSGGEDGTIQGLLEYFNIPYSGSGIGPSAWGIDKLRQRETLSLWGFPVPRYTTITWKEALALWRDPVQMELFWQRLREIGIPCVLKNPLQGSTIGVARVENPSELSHALSQTFFAYPVSVILQAIEKNHWSLLLSLTEGLLFPAHLYDFDGEKLQTFFTLKDFLKAYPALPKGVLRAWDSPEEILVEEFISGEEFSVIVLIDKKTNAVALPPTHIQKHQPIFDYRAKYLPGIVRKKTPSDLLPNREIQKAAEVLASKAGMEVYARLDGIVSRKGDIYFNDPNTTSGMLPGSLLFHQVAHVGFTPKTFLTYVIEKSLELRRGVTAPQKVLPERIFLSSSPRKKLRVAVVFGGHSTERHISVESGRNVWEKLSTVYETLPIFLDSSPTNFHLWVLPTHLLFKDNADDIRNALGISELPEEVLYSQKRIALHGKQNPFLYHGEKISLEELRARVDFVFMALHGRPGEDGTLAALLEEYGLPYNGSPPGPSMICMDKYQTHQVLARAGFQTPRYFLVSRQAWEKNPHNLFRELEEVLGPLPYVAKPTDEGCSSAVKVLKTPTQVQAYLNAIFCLGSYQTLRAQLKIDPDFPPKEFVLVEEALLPKNSQEIWKEITIGLITHTEGAKVRYQAFVPSLTVKGETILSLEEKFLAGGGQNITPAIFYPDDPKRNQVLTRTIQNEIERLGQVLGLHGYARVDAFVKLTPNKDELYILEVNTLPGLTPGTVFFHQAAQMGYLPLEILMHIVEEGLRKAQINLR